MRNILLVGLLDWRIREVWDQETDAIRGSQSSAGGASGSPAQGLRALRGPFDYGEPSGPLQKKEMDLVRSQTDTKRARRAIRTVLLICILILLGVTAIQAAVYGLP